MEKIIQVDNFQLINNFASDYIQVHDKCFNNSLNISEELFNIYIFEKNKLPYHINIIDELRANENAHSRILVKLLKYKIGNEYPILKSFLTKFFSSHFIIKDEQLEILKIVEPKITQEKYRIDALIVDEKYVVIIENKIHYAVDTNNQIENYLDIIKNLKKNKTIFIIYLTGDGGSPSDSSLSIIHKHELTTEKKYVEISYSSDIIQWIEDFRDSIYSKDKEVYLYSAIEQYIDHLKGMYNLRKEQKTMEEEIIKSLKNQLKLGENIDENITFLNQQIEATGLTTKYLEKLLLEQRVEGWLKKLQEEYPIDRHIIAYIPRTNYGDAIHYGIKLRVNGYGLCSVFVEIKPDKKTYLCISSLYVENDTLKQEIKEFMAENLITRSDWDKSHNLNYAFSRVSRRERGFQLLMEQIGEIKNSLDSNDKM